MPSRLWMMALVSVLVVTGLAPAVASADDRADRLAARQQRIAKERHKELLKRLYQAVHATSLDRTVVYFDQVKAGSQIWDERPARRPHAKQTRASVPLPHITNVYWIDQAWGQKFGHPTTLILEDTTTGLTAAKTLKFWPIVDGAPLPFVTWGRYDRRFQL
jgi:hypothetical protein